HEAPNPPSSAAAQPPERDQALSASAVPAKSRGLFAVLGVLGLALYLVPVLIAYRRNTIRQHRIAIITVLLGWTLIGWVAALIMALNEPTRTR
ncbi:MAG: superinfection immunity protein, partial [Gluconobacter potus]|uniref:superinfection immunity protein n=2 Tax=Gluconobacter TaxID=441 RepID=UPI0039EC7F09